MKAKLFAILFLSILSSVALAQDTASLTGTVRDKSGAVIRDASVTISNPASSFTREVKSNSDGEYLVAGLPAGTYNLAVTAKGFQKYEAKSVELRVAQKSRVDVPLTVGSVTTEVVVQGEGLTNVQTESNEEGAVITGKEITQLELNGRNFTQLVTLTPGVSNQTGQDEGTVGVYGNVQFSVNGGRTEYNNWELDGGDNMDNGSNSTLNVYPSIEAIGEFRVLTANYGAQYGRNGSGTIEVETKSGTNKFHGSAYEFLRNDDFNARNFFLSTVPPYKKNDFGYTIGGPIPKIKNTYFFWSEEWRRDVLPSTFTNIHVPSAAERKGNFSDLCPDPSGSMANCPLVPGTPNQFPGNLVPVDPNGAAFLAVIPNPTGVDANGNPIYSAAASFPTSWREELVRVDHDLNSKMRASFRFIHDSWNTTTATPLWSNVGSFPTVPTAFSGPGVGLVAKLTATASPTLLNEFVFSYTADHIGLQDKGPFQRPASMTIPGLFGTGTAGRLPGFQLTGGGIYGFGMDTNFHPEGAYNSNPTYTFRDNVTKVLGKHNLIFGAYFAFAQKNELVGQLPGGVGATNGFLTFNSSNSGISTGNAFADLLMGNISTYSQQNVQPKYYNRYKIFEPYLQDDWHIKRNLTLNLGLRLSLFGMYHELNHQAFNFDPTKYVQGATSINSDGTVGGNPFNGLVQCGGFNGTPSSCMQNHLVNPAPRIGFAWDPRGNGKTSVRGGYGIFFEHTNGNESNTESLEGSAPIVQVPSQSNIVGYNAIGGGGSVFFPLNVISLPNQINWPYVQQWHLDVQHEIRKNTVATVGYVGTKGTHLSQLFDLNQIAPLPLSQNPFKPGEPIIVNAATGENDCASFTTHSGVPITGQAANNLTVACGGDPNPFRPFLGFGNITRIQDSGSSIYHALQASLRHTAGRLQVNASYTWSHSIDDSSDRFDTGFVNSYNLAASRASSNFDARHIFNLSYVYDLPFFASAKGLTRTFLGGWQWSGITTFATGSPFTVLNGSFGDNAGVGNGTGSGSFPDVIGSPYSNIPTQAAGAQTAPFLVNPLVYVAPRGLTFGDAGRNSLRNPSRTNFDMAAIKNFKFKESLGLEFRAEAFNVFNHTEWGYFGGGGGSAAFNTGNLNSGTNTASCYGGPNNSAGDPSCYAQGNTFLLMTAAHNPRILQLALKLSF